MEAQLKLLVGQQEDLEYPYDSNAEIYEFPPFPCGYDSDGTIPPWTQNELLDEDDWQAFVWKSFFKEHAKWTLNMSSPVIGEWLEGLGMLAATARFQVPCSFLWAADKLFFVPARVPSCAMVYAEIDEWDLGRYLFRVVEEASHLRPCNSPMCSGLAKQTQVVVTLLHAVVLQKSNPAVCSALAAKKTGLENQSAERIAAKPSRSRCQNRGKAK